jgi:hypothetical protein
MPHSERDSYSWESSDMTLFWIIYNVV